MAREADVAVNEQIFQRGVAACRTLLQEAKDAETRNYLLYALSVAGVQDKAVRNALADSLKDLPPPGKAMLALTLHRDGEEREARRVLEALADEAKVVGATAHWKGATKYHWTGHTVDATAFALKAFLAIEPDHALVKKAVKTGLK